MPENPAWWDLFSVAKQDLLEVACEVLSLYQLPKAEYAPISKDAQREQRHLAALKQTTASPISGRPTPARSPGTGSVGAVHQLDLTRDAAAPAGEPGSDEHVNSAGQASSALRQVGLLSESFCFHVCPAACSCGCMAILTFACQHMLCFGITICWWLFSKAELCWVM